MKRLRSLSLASLALLLLTGCEKPAATPAETVPPMPTATTVEAEGAGDAGTAPAPVAPAP